MKCLVKYLVIFCAHFLRLSGEVITPELLTLLNHFHIEHDGTLPSISKGAQKAWLRPAGKERWQTVDTYSAEDRKAVLEYYVQTGKLAEKRPSKSTYQAGVICGATTFRMKKRLDYFEKLDVQVGEVVLLSGARDLDPTVEEVPPGCYTEGDAFMEIWKASPLYAKTPWKHLQHPMHPDGRRPGAADILNLWLKSEPTGPVLIVTNQPYCCYYEAIAQKVLLAPLEFEVVGEACSPDSQKTDTLLDNLARWLYTCSNK